VASLIQRGSIYYLQYCVGGKVRRVSTGTDSLQLAKEKKRKLESAQLSGDDNPLPTRTPLPEILAAYANHIRAVTRPKSAQTDIYYLRHMFGPVCDELKITSRKVTAACLKRKPKPGVDRRRRELLIEAPFLEQVTTRQISEFLSARAGRTVPARHRGRRSRHLAPDARGAPAALRLSPPPTPHGPRRVRRQLRRRRAGMVPGSPLIRRQRLKSSCPPRAAHSNVRSFHVPHRAS
jgi:hypothetical protein